ncbi:MAG: class I SAM-dependent methyltransferase [Solirubrobacterales bacterium]
MSDTYDRIGRGYSGFRQTDPRIAAAIETALGEAGTVLNVGAGAGSYEPPGREVVAVEPSAEMIAQRLPGGAPAVQASAESLPFADDSFDAAMAVFSDHHWRDRTAGLREMQRVAGGRVVILNADPGLATSFWLTRDYLPTFADLIPPPYRRAGYWLDELEGLLGPIEAMTVPVPHDCRDGFYQSYWRRPRAYLEPRIRETISVFHRLADADLATAIDRLRRDLDDGHWEERNADLLELPELDVGLRLVIAGDSS